MIVPAHKHAQCHRVKEHRIRPVYAHVLKTVKYLSDGLAHL